MNLVFLLLYFYVPKLRGKRCLSMLFHILDVNPYCFECRIMPCVVSCHPIYRINSTSACVMLCYVYCYDFCDSDDEWWCMILFVWEVENAHLQWSFCVCKKFVWCTSLNCYITLMVMLIRGHGHRVLVLWFIIIQDFRLRAVLSALFLLLAVLKPVQLNCFASEGACVVGNSWKEIPSGTRQICSQQRWCQLCRTLILPSFLWRPTTTTPALNRLCRRRPEMGSGLVLPRQRRVG